MKTSVLKVSQANPDIKKVRNAAQVIKLGGLVIFPTETVYGIGANALDATASRKIFAAKDRASDNPLIVHVSDMNMVDKVAFIPQKYRKAIQKSWPGPITFILKAKTIVPKVVTGGLRTVAVRMPANKVALLLIKESGVPIAAPSANISKRPSATNAEHALMYFNGKVDLIIDSGPSKIGLESTVLDLQRFEIVRPGAFTAQDIKHTFRLMPKISKVARGITTSKTTISPGTKYKHYSPITPLFLFTGNVSLLPKLLKGHDFVFIGSNESCNLFRKHVIKLGSKKKPKVIAKNLFNALIKLDSINPQFAVIESFDEKGIGLAIMNRVRKAANHTAFSNAREFLMIISKK